MAINPFPRVQGLDIPVALPSGARAPESAFANIASIGQAIGDYRLKQQIGDIVSSATDAQGNVDQNKALAGLARAGLVSPEQLSTMGYRQQLIGQHASDAAALEAHRRALEDTARITAERPQYHFQPPTEGDILTPSRPGIVIEAPRRPGQPPIYHPWPGTPAAPPAIPGPQSALPGGPSFAAAQPDVENAPPYRVAGPPMPPPQAPAAAGATTQPATTAARNEDYLNSLAIPEGGKTLIRAIAEYDIDPASIDAKYRAQLLAAAKQYRPDYSTSEYAKRGSPPSPEAAARIGLARGFIDRLGDTTDERGNPVPGIRSRISGGELDSYENRAKAFVGQGGPGELRRGIDEGADALLRTLTGAGMNKEEAHDYTRRYRFSPIDTQETQLRKLNELEAALRHVSTEMGRGRGGEDLLKGFKSQYGAPVTTAAATRVPDTAIRALQADPARRDEFDSKYGKGAADRVLGARR